MDNNGSAFVFGNISMDNYFSAKENELLKKGIQLAYRRIFTLEGAIRHKEHTSNNKKLDDILELLELYTTINAYIPNHIADEMDRFKMELENEIANHNKHLLLVENGCISYRLVRKMRFESDISDFELVKLIHKCQRGGIPFENPGGKTKYLDPRIRKLY